MAPCSQGGVRCDCRALLGKESGQELRQVMRSPAEVFLPRSPENDLRGRCRFCLWQAGPGVTAPSLKVQNPRPLGSCYNTLCGTWRPT